MPRAVKLESLGTPGEEVDATDEVDLAARHVVVAVSGGPDEHREHARKHGDEQDMPSLASRQVPPAPSSGIAPLNMLTLMRVIRR